MQCWAFQMLGSGLRYRSLEVGTWFGLLSRIWFKFSRGISAPCDVDFYDAVIFFRFFFFKKLNYHFHLFITSLLSFCVKLVFLHKVFSPSLACSRLNRGTFALHLVVVLTLMAAVNAFAGPWLQSHFCSIQLQSHYRCKKLYTVWVIMRNVAAAGATSIKKTPES